MNMKKMILMNYLFALALGMVSCGSDHSGNDPEVTQGNNIKLSKQEVSFTDAGGTAQIDLSTDREWSAICSEPWVSVSPANGVARTAKLTVKAEANKTTAIREAEITVLSGKGRAKIKVSQTAGTEDESLKCVLGPQYKLVYHDEFDRNGELDGSHWTHEVWAPGTVNNELQAYVNGQSDGKRVTEVRDGKLLIHCFKHNGGIYSGRVYANKSTGYRYCYIETKIKLPKGKGTWPAFWMMPVDFKSWPADGEIDIMEHVGFNHETIYTTIHCNKCNNSGSSLESAHRHVIGATSCFHVSAMEWTADYMTFYVDGEKLLTYKNDGTGLNAWPFNKAFYPIYNVAWGGQWGGQQGVDESFLPATMEVDYLRVYQK